MSDQPTTDPEDEKASIVRSVRFHPEQWGCIQARVLELGVPVGKFLRNAALAAAGAPTEAHRLREMADVFDNLPAPGASPKAAAPPRPIPVPPKPARPAKAKSRSARERRTAGAAARR